MARRRKGQPPPEKPKSSRQIRKEAIEKERRERALRDAELARIAPDIVRKDPLSYVPINLDSLPRSKKERATLEHFGFTSWRDIFVDFDKILGTPGFRQTVYNTPGEIVREFGENARGILPLLRIGYNINTGMYHAFVMESNLMREYVGG